MMVTSWRFIVLSKFFASQSSEAKKETGRHLTVSHLFDQRFHVTDVVFERTAARGG